ncbi:uncharacterized protein LOC117946764 [Etheostoma cragini]|uniref:uncharacterized protein LOC117946764 n=1 Tax=Etheostoma cragini TaxID=417921 RepID=UPI00155E748B|nr:uncharacterized protein LOC117946764 [Etheostoma cragini]
MVFFSLLKLCLLSLTQAAAGLQSFDNLVTFAILGDTITLPCGKPFIKSCTSVNWNIADKVGLEVVKAGRVTAPYAFRFGLLKDCSLEINNLVLDDARLYSCHSQVFNSSVSLQILEVTESSTSENGIIELHCYLNTYRGLVFNCNNKGIHIKWGTEDNTPLNGNRFYYKNVSDCFSKLFITERLTDHHRKWKCQLTQNDTVKATITYTTTIKDGIEEVFAAVGESVTLSCSNTSSLGVGNSVKWTVGERPLTDDMSSYNGQTEAVHVNKDSSLFISKVTALHAGDYQCSDSTDQQKLFNKIRLHTLDVTSEHGPGGDNLTLTCVLICTKECGKDFNLTWSGGNLDSRPSYDKNTLTNRLSFPLLSMASAELTCFVYREGDVMASKKWRTINPLQTPAWAALPLALLICVTAGGLYVYMKRKHNKDAGNEQPSVGMTHVYGVIQDVNNEELHQPATTNSFYDLLQAVN